MAAALTLHCHSPDPPGHLTQTAGQVVLPVRFHRANASMALPELGCGRMAKPRSARPAWVCSREPSQPQDQCVNRSDVTRVLTTLSCPLRMHNFCCCLRLKTAIFNWIFLDSFYWVQLMELALSNLITAAICYCCSSKNEETISYRNILDFTHLEPGEIHFCFRYRLPWGV